MPDLSCRSSALSAVSFTIISLSDSNRTSRNYACCFYCRSSGIAAVLPLPSIPDSVFRDPSPSVERGRIFQRCVLPSSGCANVCEAFFIHELLLNSYMGSSGANFYTYPLQGLGEHDVCFLACPHLISS